MGINGICTNGAPAPDHDLMRIHFLVIGGTVSGLSCGIALCRAGHNVTILEVADELDQTWGPHACFVPPNLSKILWRWGMGDRIRAAGIISKGLKMVDYTQGDILGTHRWHEELLKDSGGDMYFMHHPDLRAILRETAVSYGADIRSGVRIASIAFSEGERPSARLTSGEVIEADVLIGADGPNSFTRREMLGQELRGTSLGLSVYNVTVPTAAMSSDPDLTEVLTDSHNSSSWIGASHAAIGLISGVKDEYTLNVYTPTLATEDHYGKDISVSDLLHSMGPCIPTLEKLARAATSIKCLPMEEPPEVDPWVGSSGRIALVGEAAHPFPRGSVHGPAASVCDAAALGELFRHLHSDSQIDSFLQAYESIRRDRVKSVLQVELANVFVITMPAGEQKDIRDQAMRAKHQAGLDAFANDDGDVAAHWEMDKLLFAYDAEDAAAEWWNDWGLLKERATDDVRVHYDRVPVIQIHAEQAQEVVTCGN